MSYADLNVYNFIELKTFLRRHLLEDIIPFWERRGFSRLRPGIDTCLTDRGDLISDDRYLWSQLRAIWTFSALYNRIEKRPSWLRKARDIYEFVAAHGRDGAGRWCFRISPEGRILTGATSIFADGFAIIGFTELYRACHDPGVLKAAMAAFEVVLPQLGSPGSIRTAPFPNPPGMKFHAVSMIFSHAFYQLSRVVSDQRVAAAAEFHCREVMDNFLRADSGMLHEYLKVDNTTADSPAGRAVVPGHAIESMWFQIHQLLRRGDNVRLERAVSAIRRHFEAGWDAEFGGLLLGIDAEGKTPVYWKFHDSKQWWPATEALYALLLSHSLCGKSWCMKYYQQMHDYAFSHFPMPEYGEWRQRLDRKGRPAADVVALPVKDPFHLPRSLIMSITLLEELSGNRY